MATKTKKRVKTVRMADVNARDKVLLERSINTYQAIKLLELARGELDSGSKTLEELDRVRCAVDVAIKLLNPVAIDIGDSVALQQAAAAYQLAHKSRSSVLNEAVSHAN